MFAQPWTVRGGNVVPSHYPVQIVVQESDVRLGRGHVKGGTVLIPAGSPGTAVVVYVKNFPDARATGGIELPVAFFAGLHPEYDLQVAEDRVRLINAIKAHAKKGGVTGGRLVPLFLTTASGIMAVVRKLADWNKLMVYLNAQNKAGAWPRVERLLEWMHQRRCPFTLKSIKTGTWFQNSDDGKLVAFPYAALTTLIRTHLGAFLEPLSIGPPEWCDIVPYNVGPLQALSNEAAFASRLEAWAALRARFSVADNDLFRKVSNVLVLDLTKVTPTKARTMVASFLIQKAAEKESPWWQNLLDGLPADHHRIEEWAAALESTLDEKDRQLERDANFDPSELPPCVRSNIAELTHKTRVVVAAICNSIERINAPLAIVFRAWLIRQAENGPNGADRSRALKQALKSRTIGPDRFPCSKRSAESSVFRCPLDGNTTRCALSRGVRTDPDQTVGSLITATAVQQQRELDVAQFVEDSQHSLPLRSGSVSIAFDERDRPVSIIPEEEKESPDAKRVSGISIPEERKKPRT